MREVFERHNLDADRTICGGEFVNLGGFAKFVHGQDLSRQVKMSVTLELKQREFRG